MGVEAWDGRQSPINARQVSPDVELSLPEISANTVKDKTDEGAPGHDQQHHQEHFKECDNDRSE